MQSRDPERIPEAIAHLESLWTRSPELRLGQLLLNYLNPDVECSSLYFMEDDELFRRLGMSNPPPPRRTQIDLSEVETVEEIHSIFASKLKFPDFYGRNWDAFWDVLTGFDCFPTRLTIVGRKNLQDCMPDQLEMLDTIFSEYKVREELKALDVQWQP